MRYLPLLLLVLAGNVSAQYQALKTPYSDYLPLEAELSGCEQRFDKGEIIELAEGELLRARLKNDYPGFLEPNASFLDLIGLRITLVCLDLGAVAYTFKYERIWPTDIYKASVYDRLLVAFARNDDAYILNGIRSELSEFLNAYLMSNPK